MAHYLDAIDVSSGVWTKTFLQAWIREPGSQQGHALSRVCRMYRSMPNDIKDAILHEHAAHRGLRSFLLTLLKADRPRGLGVFYERNQPRTLDVDLRDESLCGALEPLLLEHDPGVTSARLISDGEPGGRSIRSAKKLSRVMEFMAALTSIVCVGLHTRALEIIFAPLITADAVAQEMRNILASASVDSKKVHAWEYKSKLISTRTFYDPETGERGYGPKLWVLTSHLDAGSTLIVEATLRGGCPPL